MFLYRNRHFDHQSDGFLPVDVHHLDLAVGGGVCLTRLEERYFCNTRDERGEW